MIFPKYDSDGKMMLNNRYTSIITLDKMLSEAKIPHTMERLFDGWQIVYPNRENYISDVIEHCRSYGCEENLLEIMGLVDEDECGDVVEGYLTVYEVFERIKTHWKNNL